MTRNTIRALFTWLLLGIPILVWPRGSAAVTVTNTTSPLSISAPTPVQESPAHDCPAIHGPNLVVKFNPGLPAGATIISSKLSGFVDDGCKVFNGASGPQLSINLDQCGPNSFPDIDITSNVAWNGSFEIDVYDHTQDGTNGNQASFSQGYNTVKYSVVDPLAQDPGPQSPDREICQDCDGKELANCPIKQEGCTGCNSSGGGEGVMGSPRFSFGIANFDVYVSDTPIWHETAVGPALRLDLQFSNYADTNAGGAFGRKWACNWNSTVLSVNAGTNLVRLPSGTLTPFLLSSNNVFLPSVALDGWLVKTGSVYQCGKPNGWVWQYAQSQGNANLYLLERVWDSWSNTVAVTYTNDRILRVTQTVPASGRYLQFSYNGTNTQVAQIVTESPASQTSSFSYASSGFLTNVVDMGGYSYAYQYTNGYLARIVKMLATPVDRLAVTYAPTPDGWSATNTHWVQLQDAAGVQRKYTWNFGAILESITRGTNQLQKNYVMGFVASRGAVIANEVNSLGVAEYYQYNDQGRVTNRVDGVGATVRRTYNSTHKVTALWDEPGNQTTYTYDTNGVDLLYETPPIGPVQRAFTYVASRHVIATESNALGETITYSYNALGLATNIYDGRRTEVRSYDAEGHLTSVLRNGALVQTNIYDASGRLSWMQDAAGLAVSNSYDGLNRIVSQTFNNNGKVSVLSNHYDCCFIDQVTDRRGYLWGYQYNDIGEKQWESNPKSLSTYYTYGVEGQPVVISNALEWTTRTYTPEGWLQRVEYPARAFDGIHAENFWYDNDGRLVKKGTISGALYQYTYDAAGRQVAAYVPDGCTYPWYAPQYVLGQTNVYDALGRVVQMQDVRGLVVSNNYNALGQVTARIYPDGSTETWTYDPWGDITSAKERAGNTTSNVYDSLARMTQQTDPRGLSTFYAYTNVDLVASVSNAALGYVWSYQYDAEKRVTQVSYPDGSQENRSYDPLGNVTQIVKGGITTAFTYDELGNLTAVVVDGATVESVTYDSLGRLLSAQNADGLVTSNALDSWGQLDTRYWPQGLQESFQYGDRGLTNSIDRLGIPVRTVPDSLGRALQQIDGATNITSYAYLSNGVNQVSSLWDGDSNKTAWTYDSFGNPTNKVYADSSQESYQFDRLNRLTNKVDTAGISTGYGYDQNGNLLSIKYGALSPVTFGYDALNRRTNMSDAIGSTVWTYDSLGRITSEQGPFGTNAASVSYDALGRMTNLIFGSYSANYSYDAKGRITSVQAPEGGYSFLYFNQGIKKAQVTYPNNVTENLSYDTLTRLTNLVYSSGTNTLLSIRYGFDNGDRRASEAWNTGRNAAYGYDRAYQLLSSTSTARPSDNVSYTYDKAGNPLHRTEMGLTSDYGFNSLNQFTSGSWTGKLTVAGELNYAAGTVTVNGVVGQVFPDRTFEASNITVSAGSNLLTAVYTGPAFTNTAMMATSKVSVTVGNPAFGYDAKGNLTNDAEFTYFYDLANRLTNAVSKSAGASVLAARYDGLGRRVEVTRNGTNVERYVYFPGSFLVLAVLDGSNQIKEVWSRGPDLSGGIGGAGGIGGILSVSTNIGTASASRYFHADAMGNVVLVSDSAGQQVVQYRFSPFGKLVSQIGDYQARFAFSSKEFDQPLGLYYYGFRYYSPKLGRWLSRDPSGELEAANLYLWVRSNPFFFVDDAGLVSQSSNHGFWYAWMRSRLGFDSPVEFTGSVVDDLKSEFHQRGQSIVENNIKNISCTAGNPISGKVSFRTDFQFGRKLFQGGPLDANFWRVASATLDIEADYTLSASKNSASKCEGSGTANLTVDLNDRFDFVPNHDPFDKKGSPMMDLLYDYAAAIYSMPPNPLILGSGIGFGQARPYVHASWNDVMNVKINLPNKCCCNSSGST